MKKKMTKDRNTFFLYAISHDAINKSMRTNVSDRSDLDMKVCVIKQ